MKCIRASMLKGSKYIIGKSDKKKYSGEDRTPSKIIHHVNALFTALNGKSIFSNFDTEFKDGSDFNDIVEKATGYKYIDFVNNDVPPESLAVISKFQYELTQIASLAKINPEEFRKSMNVVAGGSDQFTREVNQEVVNYAREYYRGRISSWFSEKYNKLYAPLAHVFLQKKLASVMGNVYKVFDKNPVTSAIFSKSAELGHANEIVSNSISTKWNALLNSANKFKAIDKELINKLFHLTDHSLESAKPKAPNIAPEYVELHNALKSEVTGKRKDMDVEQAMREFVGFRKAFDMFNYGITSTEQMFFDKDSGKLKVFTLGIKSDGRDYNFKEHKDSFVYKINQLGALAARAISPDRNKNSLKPVEIQLIERFGTEQQRKQYAIEEQPFHLRLGYSPTNNTEMVGGLSFNENITVGIPSLRYLKERVNKIPNKDNNFIDLMNDEIAITKNVFSDLSEYEFMQSTKSFLNNDNRSKDFHLNSFTKWEKDVLYETVKGREEHFSKEKQSDVVRNFISASGAITTIVGSSILMRPRSAISNYVGGKVTAWLNSVNMQGIEYSHVNKLWKAKAIDNKEMAIRNIINNDMDALLNTRSRQESAIHTTEMDEAIGTKLTKAAQFLADNTASAGIFAMPNMVGKKLFGEGIDQNTLVKFLSQRNSEVALGGSYSKGVLLQLVQAEIKRQEVTGELKYDNENLKLEEVEAIARKVVAENRDYIGGLERRAHGEFSKMSKSTGLMFAVSDAKSVGQAIFAMAFNLKMMFMNIDAFSLDTIISRVGAEGAALTQSSDVDRVMLKALATALPGVALLLYDALSSQGVTPEFQLVSNVNPGNTILDNTELAIGMLSWFGGMDMGEDNEKQVFRKLARQGGVLMSRNLSNTVDRMYDEQMSFSEALVASMNINPIGSLISLQKKFSAESIQDMKKASKELEDTPIIGGIVNRYSERSGYTAAMVRELVKGWRGDNSQFGTIFSDWLIKSEFGLVINTNKLAYGLGDLDNDILDLTNPRIVPEEFAKAMSEF